MQVNLDQLKALHNENQLLRTQLEHERAQRNTTTERIIQIIQTRDSVLNPCELTNTHLVQVAQAIQQQNTEPT